MLTVALVSGLAAFTIWHALARKQPPGVRQLYAALPAWARSFVGCPWCGGFWIAVAVVVAVSWRDLDPVITTVTAFAAGAIPGTLDSFTPDDGDLI